MSADTTTTLVLNTPAITYARQSLQDARRALAASLAAPTPSTPRGRARHFRVVEALEAARDLARRDLEMDVRRVNSGQPEAAIQAAVQAM